MVGEGLNLRSDRPVEAKSLVVRLTPEGVLQLVFPHQPTFGLPAPNPFLAPDEITVTDALMYPDGKILLSGSFSAVDGHPSTNLVRLLPGGQPDRSFTSEFTLEGALDSSSLPGFVGPRFRRFPATNSCGFSPTAPWMPRSAR